MDTRDFLKLVKERKTTIAGIALFFVIIALVLTLIQPLKYRAKSRLLILQPNTSADAYTVARSNEYVGGLISEIIYSGAFLDTLKNSNANFDRNYFSGTYKQNLKKWGKTVFARSGGDTGIISIEVYHTSPEEAKKIANAINQLIISGQSPYKFNPEQNKISIIDEPVMSTLPVKPNIPVNLTLSLVFGLLAGCSYVYLFPQERISEKLAQELFKEPKKTAPTHLSEPTFEPVINSVPANLPIFSQVLEEEISPEISEPEFNYQFRGNISNVLGE